MPWLICNHHISSMCGRTNKRTLHHLAARYDCKVSSFCPAAPAACSTLCVADIIISDHIEKVKRKTEKDQLLLSCIYKKIIHNKMHLVDSLVNMPMTAKPFGILQPVLNRVEKLFCTVINSALIYA